MKILPGGAQTYSKSPDRYGPEAPYHATIARGAYVDGLVDMTSGMGAVILGHRNTAVDRAIQDQLSRGISFPLPSKLETVVAEKLLSMLTWERAECVRYGKNGADVTGAAVKLARAVTGRKLIHYLDYHGHHPWSMGEPPMNGGVDTDQRSRRVEREDVVKDVLTYKPACVVIEGFSSTDPSHQYETEFWKNLRAACDRTGTLLVLDEMVTGFRCANGGAAEVLGIEPDLACYGKAMANGMPLSAIVGPWEYMKRFEEDVFFSTTHGGEQLSLAACLATMNELVNTDACNVIGEYGLELRAMLDECGIAWHGGYPQRIILSITGDEKMDLRRQGVLCAGYFNLTLAHSLEESSRQTVSKSIQSIGQYSPVPC